MINVYVQKGSIKNVYSIYKGGVVMSTDLSTLNEQKKNAVLQSINKNVVLMAAAGSGQQDQYSRKKNPVSYR